MTISGESVFIMEGDCGEGSEAGGVGGASAFGRRKLEVDEDKRCCLLSSGEEGCPYGEFSMSMESSPLRL